MSKHLLFIRPGAIGDSLLTFPVLRALHPHYTHITFVSNPAVLPLARALNLADELSDYQDARWTRLFSPAGLSSTQDQPRWDTAICYLRDPDNIVHHNLSTVGVSHILIAPGRPAPDDPTHVVTYLAHSAGITLPPPDQIPPFTLPPPDQISPSTLPHSDHPLPSPGAIAIHPGSGSPGKCWPAAHFASVITRLWQQYYPVLLLAGPADHDRLAQLRAQIPQPPSPHLLTLLLDAPLLTVAQHLQHCRGYLGNDSGLTHLAALLGLPTLTLFGPTNPTTWRPLGPTVTVLHKPFLDHLLVETVQACLSSLLATPPQ